MKAKSWIERMKPDYDYVWREYVKIHGQRQQKTGNGLF